MLDMLRKTAQPLHGNGRHGKVVRERYAAGFDERDGDHQRSLRLDVCWTVNNDAGTRHKWCVTDDFVALLDSAVGVGGADSCV